MEPMENMQIQYNCGAISKQTIIDRSPYTTDTALELKRIEDEANAKVEQVEKMESDPVVETKTEKIELDERID